MTLERLGLAKLLEMSGLTGRKTPSYLLKMSESILTPSWFMLSRWSILRDYC